MIFDEIMKFFDSMFELGVLLIFLLSESSSILVLIVLVIIIVSGNSDYLGNEIIGDESSIFNSIDMGKLIFVRGGGGGVNVLLLSYFVFFLIIIVYML